MGRWGLEPSPWAGCLDSISHAAPSPCLRLSHLLKPWLSPCQSFPTPDPYLTPTERAVPPILEGVKMRTGDQGPGTGVGWGAEVGGASLLPMPVLAAGIPRCLWAPG